jgi:hypothetical protein
MALVLSERETEIIRLPSKICVDKAFLSDKNLLFGIYRNDDLMAYISSIAILNYNELKRHFEPRYRFISEHELYCEVPFTVIQYQNTDRERIPDRNLDHIYMGSWSVKCNICIPFLVSYLIVKEKEDGTRYLMTTTEWIMGSLLTKIP